MATVSYVSIAPVFMPSHEPQQDYHLQLKVPALVDSFLMCCDKGSGDEAASSSLWSSLISLPRQPIGASQLALRPPAPTTKQPPPVPKTQNLELCTEILGSENGVLLPVEDLGNIDQSSAKEPKATSKRNKRSAGPPGFPPPLTTLGGGDRLRLSTKREDGRLLLLPFVPSLLEAERSHGCLRLRLLPSKPCSPRKEESDVEEMWKGLAISGSSGEERNRRIGRCKEKEEDVVRPAGGVMSRRLRREMLMSDAMWVSSS